MGIRTFLAVLIAVSIGMVPATGGAAVSTKPVEMSMSGHAGVPCCPPDDCKDSIACALKCFNFVALFSPAMILAPPLAGAARPFFAERELPGHVRSPPTHPPNV
ncbi:MAG: hypothetical protein WBD48_16620 [Pseudolabrys sp.]|jgi:hypothetical protein